MPAYSVSYAKRCVPKISYLPEHVIHDRTQPIKPTGREPLTDELYWFFEGCDNGPARAPDAISLGTQTFLVRLVHYIQEVALEDEVDRLVAFVRVQVKSIAGRLDVERTPMVDEGRVIPTAHIRTHGMEKAPAPVRPQSEPLTRTLPHEINTVICAQLFDLYAGSTIVNATGRSAYSSNSHRWAVRLNPPKTTMSNIRAPATPIDRHPRTPVGVFHGACYALEQPGIPAVQRGSQAVRKRFFQMRLGFPDFADVKAFLQDYCVLHPQGDWTSVSRAGLVSNFAVLHNTWQMLQSEAGSPRLFQFEAFYYLARARKQNTIPFIYVCESRPQEKFIGSLYVDYEERMVFLYHDREPWHAHSPRRLPRAAPPDDTSSSTAVSVAEFLQAEAEWAEQDNRAAPPVHRPSLVELPTDHCSYFWDDSMMTDDSIMGEIGRIMNTPDGRRSVLLAARPFEHCNESLESFGVNQSCIYRHGGSRVGARDWAEEDGGRGKGMWRSHGRFRVLSEEQHLGGGHQSATDES